MARRGIGLSIGGLATAREAERGKGVKGGHTCCVAVTDPQAPGLSRDVSVLSIGGEAAIGIAGVVLLGWTLSSR